MDLSLLLHSLRRLVTFNALVAVTCVLLLLIHSWVLARILWRIEASAERITQLTSRTLELVRDLHR